MNSTPRLKLFLMMVLEFFIWGAWLPLIFGYLPSLKFEVWQQQASLAAFPVASIVGMFFSNEFADRKFAAEKFLAFSHLVGGPEHLAHVDRIGTAVDLEHSFHLPEDEPAQSAATDCAGDVPRAVSCRSPDSTCAQRSWAGKVHSCPTSHTWAA